MKYLNISHPEQVVNFPQAVVTGLGKGQGLFFPACLAPLDDIRGLLEMDFISRSSIVLQHLIGDAVATQDLQSFISKAFNFPVAMVEVSDGVHALELFHGPSLAFKDFGARFMAQCLARFNAGNKTTILTATSGDTGAAVALAFYEQPGIEVVVLYPKGKVTPLQEKLFCTLGGNVRTIAIEDDFDSCQQLVKQSFDDPELVEQIGLNSANSINVARLLAQVCYYFEAVARLPAGTEAVFSVPSGNFGNVTAGLLARAIGLPIKRMIAATNENDTVPRFFHSGKWDPRPTIATADPHSALAWKALTDNKGNDETGVFLCTAHPAKFKETIEETLERQVPLPAELERVANKQVLSESMPASFALLREFLLKS